MIKKTLKAVAGATLTIIEAFLIIVIVGVALLGGAVLALLLVAPAMMLIVVLLFHVALNGEYDDFEEWLEEEVKN